MLRTVFCILLLLAGGLFVDIRQKPDVPEAASGIAELTENREDIEDLLAVLTANGNAELSLRQNNIRTGAQIARRLLSGKRTGWKSSGFGIGGSVFFLSKLFRAYLSHFRESCAQKKITGYYLYTLCKILI